MKSSEDVHGPNEDVVAWNRWRDEHPDVQPHLPGADFGELRVEGANFSEAHVEGASFKAAHAERARFELSHADGASFQWAHVEGADFGHAQVAGANFRGAYSAGADFTLANAEGTDFFGAHAEGAFFNGVHAEGANFGSAHLAGASFRGACVQGASFEEAHVEGADFRHAQVGGANFRGANLANADLREVTGLRLDDTKILHARMTTSPGPFLHRLLPWFISSPLTDPWSTLRRAYTGTNFLITLVALIAFLLPFVFQAASWRGVNLAQGLVRDVAGAIADRDASRGSPSPATAPEPSAVVEALRSLQPCLANTCEPYRVWELLLAVHRGWVLVMLTLVVVLYNGLRFYLTQAVSAYRDEEERSGFTPKWAGEEPDDGKVSPWGRVRLSLEGYQHLVWLHIALRLLLLIALVAFAVNLSRVLILEVELPTTPVGSGLLP